MSIRDERAAAITRLCRLFGDDFSAAKGALLDELENIDRAQVPGGFVPAVMTDKEAAEFAEKWPMANPALGVSVKPEAVTAALAEPRAPTDAEIEAWVARNPKALEVLVLKHTRTRSGDVQRVLGGTAPTEQAVTPAKPATRRRTAR
jgi:hypothetical protein